MLMNIPMRIKIALLQFFSETKKGKREKLLACNKVASELYVCNKCNDAKNV